MHLKMERKAMHMVFFLCIGCTYFQVVKTDTYQVLQSDQSEGEYGIILDGGSTGTKLKIFKWRKDLKSSKSALKLELAENTKFKPAISDYATNLDGVAGYLEVIIARAKEIIPPWKQPDTPIYFMATAGLRILSVPATISLLDTVEAFLMKTPFLTQGDGARVLSGEEEGVYAWIAANYLRGFFWSNKSANQSVGVLEMGGGSTQIVFLPDAPIYANMFPVRIGGQDYKLYAQSYLFYGQNFIISRINEYLVRTHGKVLQLENPCMLVGDNTTFTSSNGSVHITGSANTFKCLEILEVFLKTAEDSWCYPKPCAIGRTYQPAVGNTLFYAISAFVYTPTYLGALDAFGRLNISLLLEKSKEYCSKTLEEVTSSGQPAEFASSYCTMGLYIPSLLVDAYRFDITTQSVYVTSEMDGVTIDWAMGAMLLQLDNNMQQQINSNCDTSGTSGILHKVHKTISFPTVFIVFLIVCHFD